MSNFLWLRPLTHRGTVHRRRAASLSRPAVSSRGRLRPCLEVLEDRITPSGVITVTDGNNGGAGTVAGHTEARGGGILDYGGNVTLLFELL